MYVLVASEALAGDRLLLHKLLHLAEEGRHAVQFEDEEAADAWVAAQSEELREHFTFALEWSAERWRNMPDGVAPVRVGGNEWPLKDALACLREPLRVWVEGPEADGAFLRWVLPTALSAPAAAALRAGDRDGFLTVRLAYLRQVVFWFFDEQRKRALDPLRMANLPTTASNP